MDDGRVKVSLRVADVVHNKRGLTGWLPNWESVWANDLIFMPWHVNGKGAVAVHDTTHDAKSQLNQPRSSLLFDTESDITFADMGTVFSFGSSWYC